MSGKDFSGKDKRKYERLEKKLGLRYSILAEGSLPTGNPERQAVLLDIGGGGLRFVADEKISKESQLEIVIEFSGWKVEGDEWISADNKNVSGFLKVIGVVIWCTDSEKYKGKHEIGIRFSGAIG